MPQNLEYWPIQGSLKNLEYWLFLCWNLKKWKFEVYYRKNRVVQATQGETWGLFIESKVSFRKKLGLWSEGPLSWSQCHPKSLAWLEANMQPVLPPSHWLGLYWSQWATSEFCGCNSQPVPPWWARVTVTQVEWVSLWRSLILWWSIHCCVTLRSQTVSTADSW